MSNSINTTEIKKLLFSHGAFTLAQQMLSIFISIYIWDLTGSLYHVAVLYIVFSLAHTIGFTIWAPLVKRGHANSIKSLGLVGLIVFHISLFVLQEHTVLYLIPLAICWGLTNGMYWISYHVQNFDVTHTKNRGMFIGIERSMRTGIKLMSPILGGYLIVTKVSLLGFGNVLLVGSMCMLCALFTGWIHTDIEPSHIHYRKSLKNILALPDQWRLMLAGTLGNIGYIRSLTHIIAIYLFITLGNELEVGTWISVFAVLSVIATFVVGKHIAYKHYLTISFFGTACIAGGISALALVPSLLTYIVLGSIRDFFDPLIAMGRRLYQFNILHILPNKDEHRVEMMVIREWFQIGIGSVISFIPLLFVTNPTPEILLPVLLCMATATLISGWLMKSVKTDISEL